MAAGTDSEGRVVENRCNSLRMTTATKICVTSESYYYTLNLNYIFLLHCSNLDNVLK
jgi:hypothetical protein